MSAEPVAVVNSSVTVIEASLALAVGFGMTLDAKQVALIMAVVVAIANLIKTLWARGQVTPVASPRNNDGKELVPKPS